jgi:phage shock protein C
MTPPIIPTQRGYYRTSNDITIGGVCAGLAHKFGVPRISVKFAFAILAFFFLIGLIGYCILWIVLPKLPTR